MRLTIWSLQDRSSSYIRYPKFSGACCEFSHSGKFLVVCERKEYHDFIGIYAVETWDLLKHFQIDSNDCEDIAWSFDDRYICIWDNPVEYRVLIYSPDGIKLKSYSAYEYALGVKSVAWAPSSKLLAVGSYDEVCRIFEHRTWRCIGNLTHDLNSIESSVVLLFLFFNCIQGCLR